MKPYCTLNEAICQKKPKIAIPRENYYLIMNTI